MLNDDGAQRGPGTHGRRSRSRGKDGARDRNRLWPLALAVRQIRRGSRAHLRDQRRPRRDCKRAIARHPVPGPDHATPKELGRSRSRPEVCPRSPDIIFTETLDCGVVGEGFFAISRDICQVAGPQTQVLPSVVRQFGTLVEAASLRRLNQVETACGFDLSALNIIPRKTYFPIHEKLHSYTPLSQESPTAGLQLCFQQTGFAREVFDSPIRRRRRRDKLVRGAVRK